MALSKYVKISVDCESNCSVDIRCGGPKYLGYDFVVLRDDFENAKKLIKDKLNELDRPFLYIHDRGFSIKEVKEKKCHIWSLDEINDCIIKGYK